LLPVEDLTVAASGDQQTKTGAKVVPLVALALPLSVELRVGRTDLYADVVGVELVACYTDAGTGETSLTVSRTGDAEVSNAAEGNVANANSIGESEVRATLLLFHALVGRG